MTGKGWEETLTREAMKMTPTAATSTTGDATGKGLKETSKSKQ